MAEFSSHVPGTFCWVELSTTNRAAGVAFYRTLFGWDASDQPTGPDQVYSTFKMRGQPVAGAYHIGPQELAMGAPPHWNLYVSVADADETTKRAGALGAKTLAPPFDVMDIGRTSVLQDPTGAVFSVWQPKKHIGAHILDEVGAHCWSELATRDTKAAEAFYTKLFGWTAKHSAPDADLEYTELVNAGHSRAGMMPMPAMVPAEVPPYWMPYFQVADCDASVSKADGLGAAVLVPPHDIPNVGRFAVLRDPQGAVFAVFRFAGA